MTQVFNDTVEVTMKINGKDWLVAEAEVELSQMSTPNYVDINKMVPGEGVSVPSPPDELVGKSFILKANNQLISERVTDASEDSLLFKGKLANISAIGTRAYEGIAYDPSQQPVAKPGKNGGSGSVLNQTIYLTPPYYGYSRMNSRSTGTIYEPRTIKAKKLANKIVSQIPGIDQVDNQLTKGGVTRSGPNGSITGAYNRELVFDTVEPTMESAIDKIRQQCEAEWWFDKKGILNIGLPKPIAHELRFITDTSDGLTTPPYQSVKVVGSGIASEEGYSRTQLAPEERIVKRATWTGDSSNGYPPVFEESVSGDMPNPEFEYRNNEISTEAQAKSVARKLVEDLAKQQASGKVTVVGFPEVEPFDAIIMPQSKDEGIPNYQEGMPMGGSRYGVYKVVHKLNGSDGFQTVIHVCALTGSARVSVPVTENTVKLIDRGDWSELSPTEKLRTIRGAR